MVAHEVEPEAVDLVVAGKGDDRVDHDLLGHRVFGRDILAAGRGLADLAGRVEALVIVGDDLVENARRRESGRGRVVEDLVEHDSQPGPVEATDHRAELGDPLATVGVGRGRGVGALGSHPMP